MSQKTSCFIYAIVGQDAEAYTRCPCFPLHIGRAAREAGPGGARPSLIGHLDTLGFARIKIIQREVVIDLMSTVPGIGSDTDGQTFASSLLLS